MGGEFDMRRMQEEAVRRAREMQTRARFPQQGRGRQNPAQPPDQEEQAASSQIPAEQPPSVSAPEPPPQPEKPPEAHSCSLDKEAEPSSGGLLENLFRDKEKTIILALLILLGSEEGGQNHELMFALLFLLM